MSSASPDVLGVFRSQVISMAKWDQNPLPEMIGALSRVPVRPPSFVGLDLEVPEGPAALGIGAGVPGSAPG
jgi:hypothetical protein